MIDEKKLIKDILQHEDALKDANYVYKNGYETRQKEIIDIIERQTTVEAVQVVHGEWLDFYGDYSTAECDQCAECYEVSPDSEPKKEYFEAFKQCYNFCPNCGADMRKKV